MEPQSTSDNIPGSKIDDLSDAARPAPDAQRYVTPGDALIQLSQQQVRLLAILADQQRKQIAMLTELRDTLEPLIPRVMSMLDNPNPVVGWLTGRNRVRGPVGGEDARP